MSGPDQEPRVPPKACLLMSELRPQIDRLDRDLVGMIAERLGYIARAAELKSERGTVRDEARIEAVIANVRNAADVAGIDPAFVEAVWRVMVERSIAHELILFDAKGGPPT